MVEMTGRNQSASDVAPVRERDVGNQGEPFWGPNPEPCSHLGLERREKEKGGAGTLVLQGK